MQQDHQQLLTEKPAPAERLTILEESIAELSDAIEQQEHQLSDTQQVSVHDAKRHCHSCHCCCKAADSALTSPPSSHHPASQQLQWCQLLLGVRLHAACVQYIYAALMHMITPFSMFLTA